MPSQNASAAPHEQVSSAKLSASAICPTPKSEKAPAEVETPNFVRPQHGIAGTFSEWERRSAWSAAHDVAKITVSRKWSSERKTRDIATHVLARINWWRSSTELQLSPCRSIYETMAIQRVRNCLQVTQTTTWTSALRVLKI